jgi:enoyl-[acyl-carrier protein] reductase II
MGTRFIAAEEARASRAYKERLLKVGSADTRITRCYSGKPMRVIANPYVDGWERRAGEIKPFPAQMLASTQNQVMNYVDDAQVDPERTCMPAGQGVGAIQEILPAREIVARVMAEAEAVLERTASLARSRS